MFNKNRLIEDIDFLKVQTKNQIIYTLMKYNSCLLKYKENGKDATDIIYDNTKRFNSLMILTLLEKEQGLVRMKEMPNQKVFNRCLGFGMDDGGDNKEYYGFEVQIRKASEWLLNNYNSSSKYVNKEFKCGDGVIVPENKITYVMYKYTPWIGEISRKIGKNYYDSPFGNFLFYQIWQIFNGRKI